MHSEWIKVEDELPETSGWYICHFSDGTIETYPFEEGDDCFYVADGTIVTHWMPIPEPPK